MSTNNDAPLFNLNYDDLIFVPETFDVQKASGVYLGFVDYRDKIQELTVEPIFLNDLDTTTKQEREDIIDLLRTHYDGDELNILPVCDCEFLNEGHFKGSICPICGTVCESANDKPIESTVWFRPPKGVDTLIQPRFWNMLSRALVKSRVNILQYLVSMSYRPATSKPGVIDKLQSLIAKHKWVRSYNYLCANLRSILTILAENGMYAGTKPTIIYELLELMDMYEDRIFTPFLPIPNKQNFITERTSVGTYASTSMTSALNAAMTICSIDDDEDGDSQRVKENRTVKAIDELALYYDYQIRHRYGKKPGDFRKHIISTRVPYSGRGVIVSLSKSHNYETIQVPWTYAVGQLEEHIRSKLVKLGWTPRQIAKHLIRHSKKFCPIINELFDELIAEAKSNVDEGESELPGIPTLIHRNPSLQRGSIQLVFIDTIKRDPKDFTISFSVLLLVAPNADFDGDELNLKMALDRWQRKRKSRLHPSTTVFDLGEPRKLSATVSIPTPTISIIDNYINSEEYLWRE